MMRRRGSGTVPSFFMATLNWSLENGMTIIGVPKYSDSVKELTPPW